MSRETRKKKYAKGHWLMFYDNQEFYPTPNELAEKMASLVDMERVSFVLEPSAGKADLLKALKNRCTWRFRSEYDYSVDCIEKDENLRSLLKGEKYNVVYDDFLDFNTYKCYDLIIMNPPFSNGDKHLLKAISLIKYSGQIVCLLNAETIRNPYSNTRRELVRKLEELNAKIEYLEGSFAQAERKTMVEVALIYIDIKAKEPISLILDNLEAPQGIDLEFAEYKDITLYDVIKRMVQSYEYEIKVGIKLIEEYCRLQPYLISNLKDKGKYTSYNLLQLKVGDNYASDNASEIINEYVEKVRYKYWYALGDRPQMKELMTSNLINLYYDKISELKKKEFNIHNIELVNEELMSQLNLAVEDTILALFDEFTKHYWFSECTQNIHYYNGWATNKAHKVNKKVILPIDACHWYDKTIRVTDYQVMRKLNDIEKTMDYLNDGRVYPYTSIENALNKAEMMGITRNIDTKYFKVTFYKKGTCHLVFKNEEILKKFNIFGGQKKGWLPPNYGKKHFTDLSVEEQEVVRSFHDGEDEILGYEQVVNENGFYLVENNKILTLTA